jgi:hypothetical protein
MTPEFGINSPQTVKHISQKAFFKHALGKRKKKQYIGIGRYLYKRKVKHYDDSNSNRSTE